MVIKTICFSKKSLKVFPWTIPPPTILFVTKVTTFKENVFFSKKNFCSDFSPVCAKYSLDTRGEKFLSNFRKEIGWKSNSNKKKHVFFSKKLFFLKMFPLTRIMHFWQACRRFFAKVGLIFEDKVQKRWKSCTFSKKILKMFLWRLQMQFWKTCRKISANIWLVFCSFSKKFEKKWNFSKKSPQNVILDMQKTILTILHEFFAKVPEIFCPKYKNVEIFHFSPITDFPQTVPWILKLIYWQASYKFAAKNE